MLIFFSISHASITMEQPILSHSSFSFFFLRLPLVFSTYFFNKDLLLDFDLVVYMWTEFFSYLKEPFKTIMTNIMTWKTCFIQPTSQKLINIFIISLTKGIVDVFFPCLPLVSKDVLGSILDAGPSTSPSSCGLFKPTIAISSPPSSLSAI